MLERNVSLLVRYSNGTNTILDCGAVCDASRTLRSVFHFLVKKGHPLHFQIAITFIFELYSQAGDHKAQHFKSMQKALSKKTQAFSG